MVVYNSREPAAPAPIKAGERFLKFIYIYIYIYINIYT